MTLTFLLRIDKKIVRIYTVFNYEAVEGVIILELTINDVFRS